MKFEKTAVSGFEAAFRGMRNPLNSWDKSDSVFEIAPISDMYDIVAELSVAEAWIKEKYPDMNENSQEYLDVLVKIGKWLMSNGILDYDVEHECAIIADIGPNDMKLAQNLIKGGSEQCKFLRQINVSVDITAPLYFFKELDTYKVGTTANSTSTMHKLASTPITLDCFETRTYMTLDTVQDNVNAFIDFLESLRVEYNETKDERYWKELVRWLPESWLQTRTWSANYQVIRNMYHQRKNHKLSEWRIDFVDWVKQLPYANELIMNDN